MLPAAAVVSKRFEVVQVPEVRSMIMGFAEVPILPVVAVREIDPDALRVRDDALIAVVLNEIEPLPAVVSVALKMIVAFGRFILAVRDKFPRVCSSERVPDEKVVMRALIRPVLDDLR